MTLKLVKGEDQLQTALVMIPPHGHSARFLDQKFTLEPDQAFEGSVVIESPVPVAAAAIRTQTGVHKEKRHVPFSLRPFHRPSETRSSECRLACILFSKSNP